MFSKSSTDVISTSRRRLRPVLAIGVSSIRVFRYPENRLVGEIEASKLDRSRDRLASGPLSQSIISRSISSADLNASVALDQNQKKTELVKPNMMAWIGAAARSSVASSMYGGWANARTGAKGIVGSIPPPALMAPNGTRVACIRTSGG